MQLLTLNVPLSLKMPPPREGESATLPWAIVMSLSVRSAPGPICRILNATVEYALDDSAVAVDNELVADIGADHRKTLAVGEVVHRN